MKILVIDNYDSFTYNLVHYVESITNVYVDVFRNDEIDIENIDNYEKIILSPGPGLPDDAGVLKNLIEKYYKTKSIFGVCLGMQAIAEVFGAKLNNLKTVFHGVASNVQHLDNDQIIYKNIPLNFEAGRYHSWIVNKNSLPKCLSVSAYDADNTIMSLFHNEFDVRGVQFHPESILTPFGKVMIENWVNS
ncbi:MAG: aminodeoxychorismate/anthranilate synthase component II [Bacteroidales bacterium]|nr:aminodeoxychorismate/anthranilate synthase component II [Bacteroidales bacterium]MBN2756002.1 aminodeoxychorismate/anthranilate synthase component II [Bacteroidales bacterium]